MKIQNISAAYKTFYKIRQITPKTDNTLMPASSSPAPSSVYKAYLPNFTSKQREYSSLHPKLKEKTSNFRLTRFNILTCPACGKKILSQRKFEGISKELEAACSDEYLEILNKYKEYMRPVEESVFNEIYALSQKDGTSKEIRTLLCGLREEKLPILQDAQMRLVNEMTALTKTLPAREKTVLLKKIKKLKMFIRKNTAEAPFRRKILLDRISKVKIKNKNQYKKLQNIAARFPSSSDMNSAWIVKYSGKNKYNEDWSSLEIAKRILYSACADTDHILAYDIENNHDDISNYLAMHRGCNSQKSNKPFMQWINENRERLKFLQQYFEDADIIIGKRIQKKKYKLYSDYAAETIKRITHGRIDLKNTD